MFEKYIENYLLEYFGNFIEDMEKNKVSVGLLSGKLKLESIKLKPSIFKKYKLPFKLNSSIINSLEINIPWTSNFTKPTIISIDTIKIDVCTLDQEDWEALDYSSEDYKIKKINKFIVDKLNEINNLNIIEDKANTKSGYWNNYKNSVLLSVLDNLHIEIKNFKIVINNNIGSLNNYLSIGFEKCKIVNTDEKWNEAFIDRSKDTYNNKNDKMFKLMNLDKFYINLVTVSNESKYIDNHIGFNNKNEFNKFYLIKPMTITAKIISKNIINNTDDNNIKVKGEDIKEIEVNINLDNFDIEVQKDQYKSIIKISNLISKYQLFNNNSYQSSKLTYFKPKELVYLSNKKAIDLSNNSNNMQFSNKEKKLYYNKLFKYAVRIVIKKLKYIRGLSKEFKPNLFLINNYKAIYSEYLNRILENNDDIIYKVDNTNNDLLTNDSYYNFNCKIINNLNKTESNEFIKIIKLIDLPYLCNWSLKAVEKRYKIMKEEELKKNINNNKSLVSYIFGSKSKENYLLSEEEKEKISNYFVDLSKQISTDEDTNELDTLYNAKNTNNKNNSNKTKYNNIYKLNFLLSKGSFVLSYIKDKNLLYKEGISLNYYNMLLNVEMINISNNELNNNNSNTYSNENTIKVSSYLKDFELFLFDNIDNDSISMPVSTKSICNNNVKDNSENIWDIKYLQYLNTKSDVNFELNATLNKFDIIYRESLVNRLSYFFIIKDTFNEVIVNKAIEKWEHIKLETKNQIKDLFIKKNIININVKERKLLIPFNKINEKSGKLMIIDIGSTKIIKLENDYKNNALIDDDVDNNINLIEDQKKLANIYNKYYFVFEEFGIKFFDNYKDMISLYNKDYSYNNDIDINNNKKNFNLLEKTKANMLVKIKKNTNNKYNDDNEKPQPEIIVNFNLVNANLFLSNTIYQLLLNLSSLFSTNNKNDKENHIWAYQLQNNAEIKKNANILGKLKERSLYSLFNNKLAIKLDDYNNKNNQTINESENANNKENKMTKDNTESSYIYNNFFAVQYGGYIYFYNKPDDDNYSTAYYLGNHIIIIDDSILSIFLIQIDNLKSMLDNVYNGKEVSGEYIDFNNYSNLLKYYRLYLNISESLLYKKVDNIRYNDVETQNIINNLNGIQLILPSQSKFDKCIEIIKSKIDNLIFLDIFNKSKEDEFNENILTNFKNETYDKDTNSEGTDSIISKETTSKTVDNNINNTNNKLKNKSSEINLNKKIKSNEKNRSESNNLEINLCLEIVNLYIINQFNEYNNYKNDKAISLYSNYNPYYKCELKEFNLNFKNKDSNTLISMSLKSLELFNKDISYKHSNKLNNYDKIYSIEEVNYLSKVFSSQSNNKNSKLINVNIDILTDKSILNERKNKSEVDMSIEIGYFKLLWVPKDIMLLLEFLAYDEIYANLVENIINENNNKQSGREFNFNNNLNNSTRYSNNKTSTKTQSTLKDNSSNNSTSNTLLNKNSVNINNTKHEEQSISLYISFQLDLASMILVKEVVIENINNYYMKNKFFMELTLGKSYLNTFVYNKPTSMNNNDMFEYKKMELDITLGNLQLYDLSNYPYSSNIFKDYKQVYNPFDYILESFNNKKEIVSFKDKSALKLNFISYSNILIDSIKEKNLDSIDLNSYNKYNSSNNINFKNMPNDIYNKILKSYTNELYIQISSVYLVYFKELVNKFFDYLMIDFIDSFMGDKSLREIDNDNSNNLPNNSEKNNRTINNDTANILTETNSKELSKQKNLEINKCDDIINIDTYLSKEFIINESKKSIFYNHKLNLVVNCDNPCVILKARPYYKTIDDLINNNKKNLINNKYYIFNLGNIKLYNIFEISNTYPPEDLSIIDIYNNIPRMLKSYKITISNLNVQSENKFLIINSTDADISFTKLELSDEEDKLINSNIANTDTKEKFLKYYNYKSLINITLNKDIDLNIRQTDICEFIKISDLNLSFSDNVELNKDAALNKEKNDKYNINNEENAGIIQNINNNNDLNSAKKTTNQENSYINSSKASLVVNTYIKSINLNLVIKSFKESNKDCILSNLSIGGFNLLFIERYSNIKELQVYLNVLELLYNNKKVIYSKFKFLNTKELDLNINSSSNISKILTRKESSNSNKKTNQNNLDIYNNNKQLEFSIIMEIDGEKQISITLSDIYIIILFDYLDLIKTFFTESLPNYNPNSYDIPNKYDPNSNNSPQLKLFFSMINPSLSISSDNIKESLFLSTDLKVFYKKNKRSKENKELIEKYKLNSKDLKSLDSDIINLEDSMLDCNTCKTKRDKFVQDIRAKIPNTNQNNLKTIIPDFFCSKCFDILVNTNTSKTVSFCYKCKDYLHYLHLCSECVPKNDKLLTLNLKKKEVEERINNDKCYTSSTNIWLYNICPYISCGNNITNNLEKSRKLVTNMDVHLEITSYVKYIDDNNFVENTVNNLDISPSILKISYKDIVLILKSIEDNKQNLQTSYYLKSKETMVLFNNDYNNNNDNDNNNIDKEDSKINNNNNQLTDLKNLSQDINVNYIDKGLTFIKVNMSSFKIVLIDNMSSIYYPFISFVLSNFSYIKEDITYKSSLTESKFIIEIYTYNHVAAIWEPIIEKVKLEYYSSVDLIDIKNNTIDNNKKVKNNNNESSTITKYTKHEIIIPPVYSIETKNTIFNNKNNFNSSKQLEVNNTLNINISDIAITVISTSLINWIKKFLKYNDNYSETVKELNQIAENEITSNHRIINLTGNEIELCRVFNVKKHTNKSNRNNNQTTNTYTNNNNTNNKLYNKICVISPDSIYDLEHIDNYSDLIFNTNDESLKNYSLDFHSKKDKLKEDEENIVSFKFVKENINSNSNSNYVSINEKFGLNNKDINLVNIDKPYSKGHEVDYNFLINKYKSALEIDGYKYIISKVENSGLRKYCYLYSPFLIENQIDIPLTFVLMRKDAEDRILTIKPNDNEAYNLNNKSYNEYIRNSKSLLNIKEDASFIFTDTNQSGIPFHYLDGALGIFYSKESYNYSNLNNDNNNNNIISKINNILSKRINNSSSFKSYLPEFKTLELRELINSKTSLIEQNIGGRYLSFEIIEENCYTENYNNSSIIKSNSNTNNKNLFNVNYHKPNSSLNKLTIKKLRISSPYVIHNALNSDIEIEVNVIRHNNFGITNENQNILSERKIIKKNTNRHIDSLSLLDNLQIKIKLGDYESNNYETLFKIEDLFINKESNDIRNPKESKNNLFGLNLLGNNNNYNNNKYTIDDISKYTSKLSNELLVNSKNLLKNIVLYNRKTNESIALCSTIGKLDKGKRVIVLYSKYLLIDYTNIANLNYVMSDKHINNNELNSYDNNSDITSINIKSIYNNYNNIINKYNSTIIKKKSLLNSNIKDYYKKYDSQYNKNYDNIINSENIYILNSNYKFLHLRLNNSNYTNENYDDYNSSDFIYSNCFDLNAVNMPTQLNLKANNRGYEIMANMHLSVINQNYNINSYIIVLTPKFLLINEIKDVNIKLKLTETKKDYSNLNKYIKKESTADDSIILSNNENIPFYYLGSYSYISDVSLTVESLISDNKITYTDSNPIPFSLITYETIKLNKTIIKENYNNNNSNEDYLYVDIEKRLDNESNLILIVFKKSNKKTSKILINNINSSLKIKVYQDINYKSYYNINNKLSKTEDFLTNKIVYVNPQEDKIFALNDLKSKDKKIILDINNFDILSCKNENEIIYVKNTSIVINLNEYESYSKDLDNNNNYNEEYDNTKTRKVSANEYSNIDNLMEQFKSINFSKNNKFCLFLYMSNKSVFKIEIISEYLRRIIKITEINKSKLTQYIQSNSNSSIKESTFDAKIYKLLSQINFNINIGALGVSLITDNKMLIDSNKEKGLKYNRYEILYLKANDIMFKYEVSEMKDCDDEVIYCNNSQIFYKKEIALLIKNYIVENEYNNITYFPIISKLQEDVKNKPFFNMFIEKLEYPSASYRDKYLIFNYLIQKFSINIESEFLELLVFFNYNLSVNNKEVKNSFKKSFGDNITNKQHIFNFITLEEQIERLFLLNNNNEIVNSKYMIPLYMQKDFINKTEHRLFIEKLEISPLEIQLSIKTKNKSNIIKKYVTSINLLNIIVSNVLNLDKTDVSLEGSQINNFYGTYKDIALQILYHYHKNALPQYFKLIFSTDILGNPINLCNDIKTGLVKFVEKPAEGIVKGPFGFVYGTVEGGKSLIQHTFTGALSTASKISAGLSKGMLNITKDDNFINNIERNRLINRNNNNIANNITTGIGYISEGVTSGITDVFLKPIEGVSQKGVKGFFGGAIKGIAGLVVKPISGVFEFISHSTDGIKQIFDVEKIKITKVRKPRVFYTKDKYFKEYDNYHSEMYSILKYNVKEFSDYNNSENDSRKTNTNSPAFNLNFYNCLNYLNHKKEINFMLFCDEGFFIIDGKQLEIKTSVLYENIKSLEIKEPNRLKINYKFSTFGNKESNYMYFYVNEFKDKDYDNVILKSKLLK